MAGVFAAKGGFAPLPRSHKPGSLRLVDREVISRGLIQRRSFRQLGRHLGRPTATISREVANNGGHLPYQAAQADELASVCAYCELTNVDGRISQDWRKLTQQVAFKCKNYGGSFGGLCAGHKAKSHKINALME